MLDDVLYNNPELYEEAFPSRSKSEVCIRAFEEHLPEPPSSILDVACGTGRELAELSKLYSDCAGFDVTPNMVTYAQERNPGLSIVEGDMRTCRLGRTFDAICALGGSINFALTNDEIVSTIQTYGAHAHEGTLLLLQPLNASGFFGDLRLPETFTVTWNGSTARGSAAYEIHSMRQIIERTRTWTVDGQDIEFSDSMSFRIIFPAELTYFLSQNGFDVVDVFETPGSPAYGTSALFYVAKRRGSDQSNDS